METGKMKLALSAGAVALSMALAGCGGGSSSSGPVTPAEETGDGGAPPKTAEQMCRDKGSGYALDGNGDCISLSEAENKGKEQAENARDAKRVHAALAGLDYTADDSSDSDADGIFTADQVKYADADQASASVKWGKAVMLTAIGQSFGGNSNTANFQTVDNDANDAQYERHIYTTKAADKMVLFFDSAEYTESQTSGQNGKYVVQAAATEQDVSRIAEVTQFPQTVVEGVKTFSDGTGENGFAGKLQGAPGVYSCSTSCTARKTTTGFILGGTWLFDPNDGAMVTQADAAYQSFGWWSKQANDGMVVFRHVHSPKGLTAYATDQSAFAGGTAKYKGGASGLYSINNAQVPANNQAGEFTADVNLEASFRTHVRVSGTIDGFKTEGDVGDSWTVRLMENTSDGTSGVYNGAVRWTMNGVTDTSQGGDYQLTTFGVGSSPTATNLPAEIGGVFHAEHTGTARMAGSFAATPDAE